MSRVEGCWRSASTTASREGDPLLHTHLVIANRVQGPDGRGTALDGRDLYRHRLAADAIYRASYQRQLSRSLAVEWTAANRHGNRELSGVPEDLVRLFSKRTDQIDLEVEVDRLNIACQELLAARGRLGEQRLQVEDRALAVGDRVVCGKNAIGQLGVANGTRGTVTALDPQVQTLTCGWTARRLGR